MLDPMISLAARDADDGHRTKQSGMSSGFVPITV